MRLRMIICLFVFLYFCEVKSQQTSIDFGLSNSVFECNPTVFTTSGQSQCVDSVSVYCQNCKAILYYNTDAGAFGQDCRNWFRLANPGFPNIGTFSELQLRGAGGGNTLNIPTRFVVRDFSPSSLFAIQFDVLMAGYGGEFLFRCGFGGNYQDTVYMPDRDSFSFMVLKFDDGNPSVSQPRLRYSQSFGNSSWPIASPYFWASSDSLFHRYKKHTIAIYTNNTSSSVSYDYIYPKVLNPRSYDVYVDSVIDVNNILDTFFSVQNKINSFMFCRNNAFCGSSGLYRGDTLVIDNVVWTNDFLNIPLPVELSEFHCSVKGERATLTWATASELNNQKFEIERSSNGTGFQKVDEIAGAGNSNQIIYYSWTDSSITIPGLTYYRLKQVDFDGTSKYTDVCQVKIDPNKNSLAFPNPFTDYIQFSKKTTGILYNSLCQKILSVEDVTEIQTENLPQGVYYFIPVTGGTLQLVK